jgi:molybdate transport system substrate-binding protein
MTQMHGDVFEGRTMRIFIMMLMLVVTGTAARGEEIRVGAASSLRDVLVEIAGKYKQSTGNDVKFVFGASGKVAGQIKEGAQIDLFISATNAHVESLTKAKLADESTLKVVARNKLVLVVPADSTLEIKTIADIAGVKKLAMGEPAVVAAGEYASQVLASAKLEAAMKDRILYGENVQQVVDMVIAARADAGFVYSTDALSAGKKVKLALTVDEKECKPIVYPAVVITESKKAAAAKKFLEYLQGETGTKALAEYGFALPAADK